MSHGDGTAFKQRRTSPDQTFYQDGTRTSHRKVPAAEPYEQDFEARVKATIEAQDREIAEKSGRPRGPIKSIVKSAGQ